MSIPSDVKASIRAFVFDAYGTLFDVNAAVSRHAASIGPEAAAFAATWRAKQLEYTWVMSLAGQWVNFWLLTQSALDFTFAKFPNVDRRALRAPLLEAYRVLDAYPEARATLDRLRASGFGVALLSNGERTMLDEAVNAAGLASRLDQVMSVDEVQILKPSPRVYELAAHRLGLAPHEMCLVSSNRWDVAGAVAFGMVAVWVNRSGQPDEYPGLEPVATVADLSGVG